MSPNARNIITVSSKGVRANINVGVDSSQYYSGLARQWAISDNIVNSEDYSSKYYAKYSKKYAEEINSINEEIKVLEERAELLLEKASTAQDAAEFARRTCFYEIVTDSFISTENQQEFILSKSADSINEILGVNINNHNILKSRYSLKNENTVMLLSPVDSGCEIAITYLTGKLVPIGAVFTNIFEFEQAEPAEIWKINHKLARYPQVTIVDSSGRVVVGEVKYVDNMNVEVYFNGGFSGKAYLV